MIRLAVLNTLRSAPPYSRAFGLFLLLALTLACNQTQAQLLFADSFNYPDGPIVGAPNSPWVNNYLPANQADVVSGRLFLTQSEDESVRVDIPYVNSGMLYARFRVTFTALPTGVGNYFAFFRQNNVDNNRARVWAVTNAAPAGQFRLGVKPSMSDPLSPIAADLSLNTTYTVLLRYNVTNHACTLWIDPVAETDTARRADTSTSSMAIGIRHFAFLQTDTFNNGEGMGSLYVDDLRIGKTFADAMEIPRIASITRTPNDYMTLNAVGFPTTNYAVVACTNLATPSWVALHTNTAAADGTFQFTDADAANFSQRFYRLQGL